MKRISVLLLSCGLLATNGCISTHLINNHARSHLDFSGEELQITEAPGEPQYYALLPLTITSDVITSPIQLVYILFSNDSDFFSAGVNGIPVILH